MHQHGQHQAVQHSGANSEPGSATPDCCQSSSSAAAASPTTPANLRIAETAGVSPGPDACCGGSWPAGTSPTESGQLVPLARMKEGESGTIHEKQLEEEDRKVLRAMGLAASARVRLCRVGEPCIVAVMATVGVASSSVGSGATIADTARVSCSRIGLARRLAEKIIVRVQRQGASVR